MTKTVTLKFRPMVVLAFLSFAVTFIIGAYSILDEPLLFVGWVTGLITMWSAIWLILNGDKRD